MSRIYALAQRFSRISVAAAIVLFILFKSIGLEVSLSLQLGIALCALALGIPHGAIDHLVALPPAPRRRVVLYVALYVLIAIMAGIAIATWNIWGFRAVILMSALHFGFGDAAYFNEFRDAQSRSRYSTLSEIIYALPAGLVPLLLPLTDSHATKALLRINPNLSDWAGTDVTIFRNGTIGLAILSILLLLVTSHREQSLDLAMLLLLSLIATPLITFAIYFGGWHAIRHTARLVPKLPRARANIEREDIWGAIRAAVLPGLYALVGTLLLAAILMTTNSNHFGSSLLWSTLVIVWALTVPHMMTTSKFDISALWSR